MIDWLLAWWPIVLVFLFPHALRSWAGLLYRWVDHRLDELVPDDRVQSTEEWVDHKIEELGLVADVDLGRWGPVALRGMNAYLPWRSAIALAEQTADKKDATYWIVGAHELGHAIWHRRFPRLSRWAIGARGAAAMPWSFALTLMLVNTLWGWAVVSDILLFLLVTYAVLMAIVLVDEALASLTAFQLVAGEKFTALESRSMRIKLIAAFGTYLSTVVPVVLMLIFWRPLRATLEAGQQLAPTDPNHDWWVGVSVVVLLALVGFVAVLWIRGKLRDRAKDQDEGEEDDSDVGCRVLMIAIFSALGIAGSAMAFWFWTAGRDYGDELRIALIFGAPLAWLIPELALNLLGLPLTWPISWVEKAVGLKKDEEAEEESPLERSPEEQSERLRRIRDEMEQRRHRKKPRDPDKPWERRPKRKRKRGRFELDDLPDRGTLKFWLLQLNPIWILPPIVVWLML